MEDVHVVNADEHEQIIKELTQSPEDGNMQLINKDLKMVDPFSPNLTLEQKEAILEECKVNPMYFYDKVLGIKASRMSWDVIRTLQTYPKEVPGDHDGDWLGAPNVVTAKEWRGQATDVIRPGVFPPGMGSLYRDHYQLTPKISINQLANQAHKAWHLTMQDCDNRVGVTAQELTEIFNTILKTYDLGGYEVRLSGLTGAEESIWLGKPTFGYRRDDKSEWLPLDYVAAVTIPRTLFSEDEVQHMRERAVKLWNLSNDGQPITLTYAQREHSFGRLVIEVYGHERIRASVEGDAVKFSYHDRDGQWKVL